MRARELLAAADRVDAGAELAADARSRLPIEDPLAEFEAALGRGSIKRGRRGVDLHSGYRTGILRQICEINRVCGFTAPRLITRRRLERFMDDMADAGRAATTANHYAESLRTFVRWMIRNDWLAPNNPLADLQLLARSATKRRRALVIDEARRLLAATVARSADRLTGLARALTYKTLILTGLRIRALRGLTWAMIDRGASAIHVPPELDKTRRGYTVALRGDLLDDLTRWRLLTGGSRSPVVLPVPVTILRVLRKDLAAAGIEYRTPAGDADLHSLRVTCASWLAEAAGPEVAGAQLGHAAHAIGGSGPASGNMTARYIRTRLGAVHDALEQIGTFEIPGLAPGKEKTA